jgi:hypothetical protein
MKLIMENWRSFVEKGLITEETDIEKYIIWHGGAHLNVSEKMIPAAKAAGIRKIDEDFLIAWVTGRLASIGGPSVEKVKRVYNDNTDGRLYSRFKGAPTRYDNFRPPTQKDMPADGLTPIDPEAYNTHPGGRTPVGSQGTADAKVSSDKAIAALKRILEIDYSQGLDAAMADKVMSVIMTAVSSLEKK